MLLAGGVVGLFLMLALPGLSAAAPAVADPTLAEQPTAAATPTTEATPVDTTGQTAPPAEATPPAEQQPAPSGDGTTPATDDGAGAAPAPPPSESTPVTAPTSDGSTPAPQPVETAPPPSTGSASAARPGPTAVPEDPRPAVALSASAWTAPTPSTPTATPPTSPESQVAPAVAAVAPDPAPAADRPDPPAPPATRELTHFTFDASGPIAQAITAPRPAAPVSFTHEVQPPQNMTVELVAPQSAAPGGSSLLAVLASYILPGSGPVPPSALMMLVLLGLILAAVYAPRPGLSERIRLSGLLGPRTGHGLAVPRPG